ncbi:unnamed protein product [Closterium sp. NIES-65]|nr:unnamed protein product [Closterium sp. NIES-65]
MRLERERFKALYNNDLHFEALEVLKGFLAPFNAVSKVAERSLYPTISMVIPSYNDMLDGLEAKRQGRPSMLVMEMTVAALGHFKKYVYASSDDLLIATFLDPATREGYFALGTWENRHPELVSQGGRRRARGPVMVDEILILVRTRVEAYQAHGGGGAALPDHLHGPVATPLGPLRPLYGPVAAPSGPVATPGGPVVALRGHLAALRGPVATP